MSADFLVPGESVVKERWKIVSINNISLKDHIFVFCHLLSCIILHFTCEITFLINITPSIYHHRPKKSVAEDLVKSTKGRIFSITMMLLHSSWSLLKLPNKCLKWRLLSLRSCRVICYCFSTVLT